MEKVRICIIGGGSRLWAIRFLQDLTLQDKVSAHVVLYDIDKKAALNNEAVANEIFKVNDSGCGTTLFFDLIFTESVLENYPRP